MNWYKLIIDNVNKLGEIVTKEMGKPLNESKGEIIYAADFVRWYAEEARRIYGETVLPTTSEKRILVIKQPIGVIAAITPWNYPAAMITRKIAPALAAGCTAIIKPAEQTPITGIYLIKLLEEAGLPKGVCNLITGEPGEIGKALLDSPIVKKITFTGSTEVGKLLMSESSRTLKRISLELGGHAPFIIFEDADLDRAVYSAVISKFRNSGQACVCTNRIYVHEKIKEEFLIKFNKEVSELVVGDGFDPTVSIGPMIDYPSYKKVCRHVEDAVNKGAEVLVGGNGYTEKDNKVYFFQPTILTNVNNDMLIMQEETFGPVVPVISFSDEKEMIKQANSLEYGLAAYLLTNNLTKAIKISEQLEFGTVTINDGNFSAVQAPFGGIKESGFGKEGGHQGIDEFIEEKYISVTL